MHRVYIDEYFMLLSFIFSTLFMRPPRYIEIYYAPRRVHKNHLKI